ncbi:MAG: pseudouridylate synthase [Cyclobacteriaceae bacterium]
MSVSPNFHRFKEPLGNLSLPERLNNPFDYQPNALLLAATSEVQELLRSTHWNHNFGLGEVSVTKPIGKMFGVLVVRNTANEVGYLAGFSGKIGGKNHFKGFVPPVYDGLKEGSFLNLGMQELTRINAQISKLDDEHGIDHTQEIIELKKLRRDNSNALQGRIFDNYQFLNVQGESKSLKEIFDATHHSNPPGGAGECAAPKLLQYAFLNKFQPLAIAEFFWGHSPKSVNWKHMSFYPACTHKCRPILNHMLKGIDLQ